MYTWIHGIHNAPCIGTWDVFHVYMVHDVYPSMYTSNTHKAHGPCIHGIHPMYMQYIEYTYTLNIHIHIMHTHASCIHGALCVFDVRGCA